MIVYYTEEKSKDFHFLLKNIALYLKKYYNATLIESKDKKFLDKGIEYNIFDCELLIHYPELDTYKCITFADYQSPAVNFLISRNNINDLVLCSQYYSTILNEIKHNFTFKKSIYTPSSPYISLDTFHARRLVMNDFEDKFIFRGTFSNGSRTSTTLLKSSPYFTGNEPINIEQYFDELTTHKVGLSLPGTGELCYRDIEYMAIGIPMMRFQYVTELNPPLIPNYHYISLDRIDKPEDFNYNGGVVAVEREGSQEHVDAYIKKFLEVKDDKNFLNFISNNAREYYNNYLHPLTRLNHTLKLLEIY